MLHRIATILLLLLGVANGQLGMYGYPGIAGQYGLGGIGGMYGGAYPGLYNGLGTLGVGGLGGLGYGGIGGLNTMYPYGSGYSNYWCNTYGYGKKKKR
ncbi:unnamed protein product [Caenorhabditis bovis]|uniref:Uncharacterized protein n=1 Tax=Caenorhabditis bovis TaxID=2654633 RepID=A0A8S1E3X4_9PELO|nr:unnamed protein product [Caenorhabditis bovis]